jgi:ribosomal protein S18 acetylase RimI-like enzyme
VTSFADAELAARQNASHLALFAEAIGSAGSVLHPAEGIVASVNPVVPERSMPNSVVYLDGAPLDDAVLDELDRAYAAADVRAWTVWVRPGDDDLASRLAARGHAHDAQPMLMAAPLSEMDLEPRGELDVVADADWALAGRLNDRAYGLPGDFERLGARLDDPASRLWVARADGSPAGCAAVRVAGGDAEVWMVAVVPEARGRGLAGELMRHALTAARAAGATTTSLESTKLGEPVYRRLGYRALGRFGMWERRTG